MFAAAPHYQAIALDLPGLGDSSPPPDYRKSTIAGLVWSAVRAIIPDGPVRLVGHDWGGIVSYLCAHAASSEVSRLAVIDVVTPLEFAGLPLLIPGGNPAWHFDHGSGKPGAISEAAIDAYTAAYRRPGAMSAGFDYYRCVFDDIEDTRQAGNREADHARPRRRRRTQLRPGSRRVIRSRRTEHQRRCHPRRRTLDTRGVPSPAQRSIAGLPRLTTGPGSRPVDGRPGVYTSDGNRTEPTDVHIPIHLP